ncbi:MAG TPA: ABC transporter ATP-binding protein [Ignavibacteria bacterium]|nr:ABC transporter ATP-binding protein [Ignavibacteria bacterium]
MILAENLVKVYPGGVKAVDDITFDIVRGEVCGYLGSNGAGKSTTIKMLCGMLQPDSGRVTIDGIDMAKDPNIAKKLIGYVPESGALFLSLTPFDFLEFTCRMYEVPKDIYTQRIGTFMEMFDLKKETYTPMHSFSKGMRQKVLIIASLIHDPEVIIWDEPLSGIDYDTTITVRNLVKELSAAGKTFFYSTHLIESVDKICTRVIILKGGKILRELNAEENNRGLIESIMQGGQGTEAGESIRGLYKNS